MEPEGDGDGVAGAARCRPADDGYLRTGRGTADTVACYSENACCKASSRRISIR